MAANANLLRYVRTKTVEGATGPELDAAVKAFNEVQQEAEFIGIQYERGATAHIAYITYIPGTPE